MQPAGRIALRLFIDVSWWVIITLILVNMISGIIIDSFAQLRAIDDGLRAQLETKCIICESDASELNTQGSGYRRHIMEEHNLWNYVWLRLALRNKMRDVSESRARETRRRRQQQRKASAGDDSAPLLAVELSGQEAHLWEMLELDDRSYLPQGRAMCLNF